MTAVDRWLYMALACKESLVRALKFTVPFYVSMVMDVLLTCGVGIHLPCTVLKAILDTCCCSQPMPTYSKGYCMLFSANNRD